MGWEISKLTPEYSGRAMTVHPSRRVVVAAIHSCKITSQFVLIGKDLDNELAYLQTLEHKQIVHAGP